MADLASLPAATLKLLDEMSAVLVGGEEPRLVPSLLRHFADDPSWLALIWTTLQSAATSLGAQRSGVALEAHELARRLPHPVSQLDDPALRETAARFVVAMSAMLVAGEGLRAALG